MAKIPSKYQPSSATKSFNNALNSGEYKKLSAQFTKLVADLNEQVVEPNKQKGTVKIFGEDFSVKPYDSREQGRKMARSSVDYLVRGFKHPNQWILTNKLKTPQVRNILVTVPNGGDLQGQISFIVVENNDGSKLSYTPKTDTFVKIDEAGKRERITS